MLQCAVSRSSFFRLITVIWVKDDERRPISSKQTAGSYRDLWDRRLSDVSSSTVYIRSSVQLANYVSLLQEVPVRSTSWSFRLTGRRATRAPSQRTADGACTRDVCSFFVLTVRTSFFFHGSSSPPPWLVWSGWPLIKLTRPHLTLSQMSEMRCNTARSDGDKASLAILWFFLYQEAKTESFAWLPAGLHKVGKVTSTSRFQLPGDFFLVSNCYLLNNYIYYFSFSKNYIF
jgi:hypothetical protein